MKKILYILIFPISLLPSVVFASSSIVPDNGMFNTAVQLNFDPLTDNQFMFYNPSGTLVGITYPNDYPFNFITLNYLGFDPNVLGVYKILAMNSSTYTCDIYDYNACLADPALYNQFQFEMTNLNTSVASSPDQRQQNLFNGFILFYLTVAGIVSFFLFKFKR